MVVRCQCCTPNIIALLVYIVFRELYHGVLWCTDPRFRAPMVNLVDGTSVIVRDCVSFHHPNLGNFTYDNLYSLRMAVLMYL